MGTLYGDLDKLLNSLKNAADRKNINFDEKLQREILELYFEKYLISPFKTPELAIKYIEKFPRKASYEPRRLRHFNEEERADRKRVSETVRNTMLSFLLNSNSIIKEYEKLGKKYDRGVYRYFYSPMPGEYLTEEKQEQYRQYNDEVAFLFNLEENWQQYAAGQAELFAGDAAQKNAFLNKYHLPENTELTKEVILDTFARRRSEIMIQLFHEHSALMSRVDELTNEALFPNELASNFWKLQKASQFFVEFGKSVEAPALPLKFTEAELQEFGDVTRFQTQSAHALNKFGMIANPVYEYIDIDALDDYAFATNEEGSLQFDYDTDGADWDEDTYNDGYPLPNNLIYESEEDIANELQARYPTVFSRPVLNDFFHPVEYNVDGSPKKDRDGNLIHRNGLAAGILHSAFDNLFSDCSFYFYNANAAIKNTLDEQLKNFGLGELHQYQTRNINDPRHIATVSQCYAEEIFDGKFTFSPKSEPMIEHALFQGTPVAFTLNGRTLIASMSRDNVKEAEAHPELAQNGSSRRFDPSCVTYENCEVLYNYSLKSQQDDMTQKLDDSDSALIRSSDAFKEMKENLRQVAALNPLQAGESTADSLSRFRKLLYSTESYLTYKKDEEMLNGINSTKDTDRSTYELKRVKAAREIRTFAMAKIKELELTNEARETLRKFTRINENGQRVLLDEATRNDLINTADREAEPAIIARQQRAEKQQRQEDPLSWIDTQISKKYSKENIGKESSRELSEQARALQELFTEDDFTDKTSAEYDPYYKEFSKYADEIQNRLANLVGGMVAAEMILSERRLSKNPSVPGAFENFFGTANDVIDLDDDLGANITNVRKAMNELGFEAMKQITRRDFTEDNSFSLRDLKDILESFNPGQLAETMQNSFCEKWHIAPLSTKLYNDYVLPLTGQPNEAIQKFATDHIVKPFETNYNFGQEKISQETCGEVLASAMLYDMLLDESRDKLHGKDSLNAQLLDNPDVLENIRKNLKQSDAVSKMLSALPENAVASGQVLADMLAQTRQPEFVKEKPVIDADLCRKQLAAGLYESSLGSEISKMISAEAPDAAVPASFLKALCESSREDVIRSLADSAAMDDLFRENTVNGKVPFERMAALTKRMSDPRLIPELPFINQDMACALLSEAILTSVTKLQVSRKEYGLQKMRQEQPENYRAMRLQIASTPELRNLVSNTAAANNGPNLSLNVITALCRQAKDVPFCVDMFQKTINNIKTDEKQNGLLNSNQPEEQKKQSFEKQNILAPKA